MRTKRIELRDIEKISDIYDLEMDLGEGSERVVKDSAQDSVFGNWMNGGTVY